MPRVGEGWCLVCRHVRRAAARRAAGYLGLFAIYEGLRAEGVYRFPHPLKVQAASATVVKRLEDGTEIMVRPGRTLIRVREVPGSVGRVADADLPDRMIAALVAAGVPASVVMMMSTMRVALDRLSEQCLTSMFDWWVTAGRPITSTATGRFSQRHETRGRSP